MTASKNLKTPTMLIPLAPGQTMAGAKELARGLSRLPLVSLLKHTGEDRERGDSEREMEGLYRQERTRL